MRDEILSQLYWRQGEYVSGQELADKLGITRVAVWKNIEALKEEGYLIEAVSRKGYLLRNGKEMIIPGVVKAELRGCLLGRDIIYYSQLDSTNEEAKRRINAGCKVEEGTVIVAGRQTAGRGRMGRKWESPAGGLWFSVVLSPELAVSELALLSLVFARAVAKSLDTFLPGGCQIKWPNDVYVKGRKLAGILLELSGEMDRAHYLVAGVGINVNVAREDLAGEIRDAATSLYIEAGRKVDINKVLTGVLKSMDDYYNLFRERGFSPIREEFKACCMHLGRKVRVKRGEGYIEGINEDIDFMGNMVINTGKEIIRISTGDVSII
ncbi:BirA family transcriptional regulator, biotin operon repressor / biotin-[acetyl-CoA-carboxylase] ligase [Thermosyntropha lipolytica DSM 11003]|uniref:Bifunctional ligase/repressor BirA n=1 Tax=Thermosyntropha lipolytica DSM 11003 TaxID=1123382 RepID=A0A1M5PIR6_9FIRM|nr:biotin--[acetyl-CoA-carboxylase] ligase [Thermosyntropha lipolytica]SHH01621.1 BirA family transcriptional regulator, biotin operon repressor / biotin-[acetyl-CoA-carboxylase] ligase [Thermosyntropha lipolytica DSM 11003]